jgi:hypothetical protein
MLVSNMSELRTNLRPEHQLLLAACAHDAEERGGDWLQAFLGSDLDWAALRDAAVRHGVVPLLHRALGSVPAGSIPEAARKELEHTYARVERHNLLLVAELLGCLDLLQSHGISGIPWRGPVLAAMAYGDLGLRQFDDLDLLVHHPDVLRASQLLVERGYSVSPKLTPTQQSCYLRSQAAITLWRVAGTRLIVELHWQLAEDYFSFPLGPDQLWSRLVPVSVEGHTVQTLSSEDLLLFLCAHGTKHLWVRLAWIADVARVLQASPNLDWAYVLRQAQALGSQRMLWLGLLLAHDLLAAPLPADVASTIRAEGVVRSLAPQARQRLFAAGDRHPTEFESVVYHLRARERWRDRLRYAVLLAVLLTPGDWDAVRLPDGLFPLYYLLRPLRLLKVYLPRLARGPG